MQTAVRSSGRASAESRRSSIISTSQLSESSSSASQRPRRSATKRDATVERSSQEVQVNNDGFTFKKKRKDPEIQANDSQPAPPAKPTAKAEVANDGKAQKKTKMEGTKAAAVVVAAEPVEPVPTNGKTAKKKGVPDYPQTGAEMPQIPASLSAAPEACLQKYLDTIFENENRAVTSAFQGDHKFVAESIKTVSSTFLSTVQDELVKSVRNLRKLPKDYKNPQNLQLCTQEADLTAMSERMMTEIKEWDMLMKKWKSEKVPSTSSFVVGQSGVPGFLTNEDRQFLSQRCDGMLSTTALDTYKQMAIKGDRILHGLRAMRNALEASQSFQDRVADQCNKMSQSIYAGDSDPRQLLQSVVATGTAVAKAF